MKKNLNDILIITLLASVMLLALNLIISMPENKTDAGYVKSFFKDTIMPWKANTYKIHFIGGQKAFAHVMGNGHNALNLYVYDEKGNLVASDTNCMNTCDVRWSPARTGYFTVKVVNCGGVFDRYSMEFNSSDGYSNTTCVGAGKSDQYDVHFNAGEPAMVTIMGDENMKFAMKIYDDNHELITSYKENHHDGVIHLMPQKTGNYKIEIINKNNIYANYTFTVN